MLVAALGVAGCATGPRPVPEDTEGAWRDHREQLRSLERWRAEGRLSVRTGTEGGQASFVWIEEGAGGFRLRLSGPWGQGGARLQGGGSRATLVAADGQRFVGRDARGLLSALYGWEIPVGPLRRWLIGLPTDGAAYTLDRFGRLETLDWRGWRLDYGRYRRAGEFELPAVLKARHAATDTEVRVAVDAWRTDTEGTPAPESPVPLIGG